MIGPMWMETPPEPVFHPQGFKVIDVYHEKLMDVADCAITVSLANGFCWRSRYPELRSNLCLRDVTAKAKGRLTAFYAEAERTAVEDRDW